MTTYGHSPHFDDIAEATLEEHGGQLTAAKLAFELAMAYEAGQRNRPRTPRDATIEIASYENIVFETGWLDALETIIALAKERLASKKNSGGSLTAEATKTPEGSREPSELGGSRSSLADRGSEESAPARAWRVGRSIGNTIYFGDMFIGSMVTPYFAKEIVDDANRGVETGVAQCENADRTRRAPATESDRVAMLAEASREAAAGWEEHRNQSAVVAGSSPATRLDSTISRSSEVISSDLEAKARAWLMALRVPIGKDTPSTERLAKLLADVQTEAVVEGERREAAARTVAIMEVLAVLRSWVGAADDVYGYVDTCIRAVEDLLPGSAEARPLSPFAPAKADPCEHGFYSNEDAHECWRPRPSDAKQPNFPCDECNGRGWHHGECHPREECGHCAGTGDLLSDAALRSNLEAFATCNPRYEKNATFLRELSREVLRLRPTSATKEGT